MASFARTKDRIALSACHSPPPLISPSSRSSSAFASSTTSTSTFFARASSTTRVNVHGLTRNHNHNPNQHQSRSASSSSSSVRFLMDRPISPSRPISIIRQQSSANNPKRTCLCSPTTHPGSFRCAFHRALSVQNGGKNETAMSYQYSATSTTSSSGRTLNCRRSAMTNSLVRIGGVEGEWVKRALAALIRPSSHHLRRRAAFQSRPSRLSVMSKAGYLWILFWVFILRVDSVKLGIFKICCREGGRDSWGNFCIDWVVFCFFNKILDTSKFWLFLFFVLINFGWLDFYLFVWYLFKF